MVFISFQGAAAAAAGRGSPPPPGRRGERVGRDSINALFSREIQYKRDRRGRGLRSTTSPAPRPRARFCETCRRKWRVRVCVRRCAQHGGFRPLLNLPLFLCVLLQILHRFPLGIMDSATSDFRPLTLFLRFKPSVFSSERNVFPPPQETLRFLK